MLKILSAFALLALATLPAAAQADRTGDITATGTTKPPSRDASPTSHSDINRRSANEANQDAITKGICTGCSPK